MLLSITHNMQRKTDKPFALISQMLISSFGRLTFTVLQNKSTSFYNITRDTNNNTD